MFLNLVFSGGGLKGIYYIGVLKYLYEHNLLNNVRNVIGSSVGAVIAMLCCIQNSRYETIRTELDKAIEAIQNIDAPSAFENVFDIGDTWGFTEGKGFMDVIGKYLEVTVGSQDITFLDFAKHTGRNLVVVGSNLTKRRPEYFSIDTHPQMSVWLAIRISISVPLVFNPVKFNDCLYVDACIYNHVPYDYFPTRMGEKTLAIEIIDERPYTQDLPTDITMYLYQLLDAIHSQLNKKDVPKNVCLVQINHDGTPILKNFEIQSCNVEHYIERGYAIMAESLSQVYPCHACQQSA